jgi:hypothetical protein
MKSDVFFILENAGWPALLLDGSGTILRTNPAAVNMFGPVLEGEAPLLSAIWSAENGMTPEQFLAHWGLSPEGAVALKFLVKGGGTGVFLISICSFNKEGGIFLFFRRHRKPPPRAVQNIRHWKPASRKSKNWIARFNWRGRCRWISTTR